MRKHQLRELARLLSIQTTYEDAGGRKREASKDALLAALKLRVPEGMSLDEALRERKERHDRQIVESVIVAWGRRAPQIPLRLPRGIADADVEWTVGDLAGRIALRDVAPEFADETFVGKTIALPQPLAHGYHVVHLTIAGRKLETFIIAAPMKAPVPEGKEWGLFLPVHALESGNLRDLQNWREWMQQQGGGFAGTLPLLASFEDERSPYSPVSRLFWNERYLDPTRLPEYRDRSTLHEMSKRFVKDEAFLEWARQGAYGYAHFRAAKEERDSADYHLYVQYRMAQQMREVGKGLYLDFPLGVHPQGYDAWKYERAFAKGATVGAPPDLFFTKGQNWGSPPPDPDAIREQRHDYFRACIRHHVAHASILRIDHVMGLHRLFWIPEGGEPKDGVYVRYPEEELYAILILEARLHDCAIVGEDLGTVPPYVPKTMKKHGLRRMYVVQYEQGMPEPPEESIASVNTHDMPTFAGFWHGRDIDDRREQGLLDRKGVAEEREKREGIRRSMMSFLKARGLLPDESGDKAVLEAILRFLAGSQAELVLINVEDLWLETEPQNVPGVPERSWKQKFRHSLEHVRNDREIVRILRAVNEARKGIDGSQT